MKCIWLGQAGLLFELDGLKIMVDPYLSDSVAAVNPENRRRVEVEERFLEEAPDVLILTHDHLDHTDPETLEIILKKGKKVCVLASANAWKHVRSYGQGHNYVLFDAGTEWTQGGVHFQAVHARHSDEAAIGVLITWQGKTCYVTGDTLYHGQVLEAVKAAGKHLEAVFLPINGVGNNMNMTDAARFAAAVGAEKTVPVHFGLFDDIRPETEFICENKVVPEIYREIPL